MLLHRWGTGSSPVSGQDTSVRRQGPRLGLSQP